MIYEKRLSKKELIKKEFCSLIEKLEQDHQIDFFNLIEDIREILKFKEIEYSATVSPKSFKYLGRVYCPIKTLDDLELSEAIKIIKTENNLTPKNWNYDNFYKIANKNNCNLIDVFQITINKRIYNVIPGTNYLFEYNN